MLCIRIVPYGVRHIVITRSGIVCTYVGVSATRRAAKPTDMVWNMKAMRTRAQMTQKTIKMESSDQVPARILILPKDSSPDARICTLAHPRSLTPTRYYYCPTKGLYEFTRVSASKGGCNSWLIGRQTVLACDGERRVSVADTVENPPSSLATDNIDGERAVADGYIVGSPELFIATPIDPLFLVIPSFLTQSSAKKTPQINSLFLSSEDLLDSLLAKSKHFEQIIAHRYIRRRMEQRMSCVCDLVEAGDEKMYRLNPDKLLKELRSKASRILAIGLPASMEEKFIQKALEAPVTGVKRMESSFPKDEKEFQEGINTSGPIRSDGASSESSSTPTRAPVSAASTDTDITAPEVEASEKVSNDIPRLLRLRTILSFIISTYLPPVLAHALTSKLSSTENSLEFTQLDEHLAHLKSLRVKALASRPLSDFSRKRGLEDDGDEAAEIRAEKKRKKDEEDKRNKAGESRGVKNLKKADVSGMKKMSAFFKGEGKKNSK